MRSLQTRGRHDGGQRAEGGVQRRDVDLVHWSDGGQRLGELRHVRAVVAALDHVGRLAGVRLERLEVARRLLRGVACKGRGGWARTQGAVGERRRGPGVHHGAPR